jgi:catechol 2,3-dioxygenase-like lactoylglutathione lyase family enzyme
VSGDREARTDGFFHIGITVADIDRSLVFYRDILGLEVTSDTTRQQDELGSLRTIIGVDAETARIAFLRVPPTDDVFVELFQYTGVEQHPASARPWDLAASHCCFYVHDAEEVYRRLLDGNYRTRGPLTTVASGPHAGAKAVYAIDPDGYVVEIYQRAPQ